MVQGCRTTPEGADGYMKFLTTAYPMWTSDCAVCKGGSSRLQWSGVFAAAVMIGAASEKAIYS